MVSLYFPIAKMNIVRILMSLVAHFNQQPQQYDVNNAFLHEDLEEENYINIPLGCKGKGMINKVSRSRKT